MEIRRVFDIPLFRSLGNSQKEAAVIRSDIGRKAYSTNKLSEEAMRVTAGALDKGLERGDKVLLIAKHPDPEWLFFDIGLQQAGVIPVPLSPQLSEANLTSIIIETKAKYAIVADREVHDLIAGINERLKSIRGIYSLEATPDIPDKEEFKSTPDAKHLAAFETFKAAIHEDDTATIVYTEGTRDKPKGVILSHKNLVSAARALNEAFPVSFDQRTISMLPLYYITERVALYSYLIAGASIHFIRRNKELFSEIKSVRPHYFVTLPSVLEEFYAAIIENMKSGSEASKRRNLTAIRIGREYRNYDKLSLPYYFKLKWADIMVFRDWRKFFGSKIEGILVGTDAVSPSLARLFSAAGIDIREGYGMTETAGLVSLNRFRLNQVNFGSVGKPLEGVEIKIEEPKEGFSYGEILIKSNQVAKSYLDENENQGKFTDGWLRTGDLGRFTKRKGFLQIAGKAEELIRLENDGLIHPVFLEKNLRNSPFVGQCMVLGENRPFASALIVPSFTNLFLRFLKDKTFGSNEEVTKDPDVIDLFRREIQNMNQWLKPEEHIAKFRLLSNPWTIETGELSYGLKKKRDFIEVQYGEFISEMYDSKTGD